MEFNLWPISPEQRKEIRQNNWGYSRVLNKNVALLFYFRKCLHTFTFFHLINKKNPCYIFYFSPNKFQKTFHQHVYSDFIPIQTSRVHKLLIMKKWLQNWWVWHKQGNLDLGFSVTKKTEKKIVKTPIKVKWFIK